MIKISCIKQQLVSSKKNKNKCTLNKSNSFVATNNETKKN